MITTILLALALAGSDNNDSKVDIHTPDLSLKIAGKADARDLGLAVYPGARRTSADDSNGTGLNFAFSNSSSDFKLVVQKYESNDSPERVLHFYEKELAHHGTVKHEGGESGNERGLKVGPKDNQYAVSVKAERNGSSFTLVRVRVRDGH